MELHELENRKKVLDRLIETVSTRSGQYGGAALTVLLQRESNNWCPLLSKLEFRSTEDPHVAETKYDYDHGTVQLVQTSLDIIQARGFLDKLMNGVFYLSGFPTIGYNGNFDGFSQGVHPRAYTFTEWSKWPADVFIVEQLGTQGTFKPSRPLVSARFPLFPDFGCVLRDCFGVSAQNWAHYFNGRVVVVCPDYRARIRKVIASFSSLSVEVENHTVGVQDLRLKVYVEGRVGVIVNTTFALDQQTIVIPLEQRPVSFSLAILSATAEEVLHYKRHDSRSSWRDPDVQSEVSSSEVEQMLLTGESETIEFRLKLKEPLRLAKSVVAFANTEGGTIVFGVDRESNVAGSDEPDLADKVTDCIAAHCDPPPPVRMERISFQGKELLLVRVPKSGSVVHTVQRHGPYIRANSTSRPPTSYELSQMLGKSNKLPFGAL